MFRGRGRSSHPWSKQPNQRTPARTLSSAYFRRVINDLRDNRGCGMAIGLADSVPQNAPNAPLRSVPPLTPLEGPCRVPVPTLRKGHPMLFLRLCVAALAAACSVAAQAETVNICDRTPQVRDAILELLRGDCATVDSEALANIRQGRLRQLTALRAGDFDGLTSLEELRFGHNHLTALPAGVFDNLTSLQELHLNHNQLKTLPDGLFDNLTSLQELHLNHNQLKTLPDGVFDNLKRLQRLYLGENHLVGLTEDDPLFDSLNTSPSGLEYQAAPPK